MRYETSSRYRVPTIRDRRILENSEVSPRDEVRLISERESQGRLEWETPTSYETNTSTRLEDILIKWRFEEARKRSIENKYTNEVLERSEPTILTRRETPSRNQTPVRFESEVERREKEQREILARLEAEAEGDRQLLARYQM